jgi:hypothetical protein
MPDADAAPRGSPWLRELYDLFAPVRESFAKSGMTEDEINAEIDAAIREMRAERRAERESLLRMQKALRESPEPPPEG